MTHADTLIAADALAARTVRYSGLTHRQVVLAHLGHLVAQDGAAETMGWLEGVAFELMGASGVVAVED